jgi:hypothetical protein
LQFWGGTGAMNRYCLVAFSCDFRRRLVTP